MKHQRGTTGLDNQPIYQLEPKTRYKQYQKHVSFLHKFPPPLLHKNFALKNTKIA